VRPIREPETNQADIAPEPLPTPRFERTDDVVEEIVAIDPEASVPLTRPERQQRERPAEYAAETETAAEPAGIGTSWTRFWEWAKDRGYRDGTHLKELLGVDVMSMSPRDVQRLIKRYEMDHPPPGREE
jgi:hypothetical protein